jgi:hypothetical protein
MTISPLFRPQFPIIFARNHSIIKTTKNRSQNKISTQIVKYRLEIKRYYFNSPNQKPHDLHQKSTTTGKNITNYRHLKIFPERHEKLKNQPVQQQRFPLLHLVKLSRQIGRNSPMSAVTSDAIGARRRLGPFAQHASCSQPPLIWIDRK